MKFRFSVFLVLCLQLVSIASAAPKVEMLHNPPQSEQIPPPGDKMILTAQMSGSKDFDLKMKAFVVSDGRLMDVPMEPRVDEHETLYYDLNLRAPLAELTYQFFLTAEDGSTVISRRYQVRRRCLPRLDLSDSEIPNDIGGSDRVNLIINKAEALKGDINSYVRTLELLTRIKDEQEKSAVK